MAIGTWTTEKLKSLQKRAEEIAEALHVPEDKAWSMMQACDTQKVMETVERMEKAERQRAQAELRAKAAYASTFKSNIEPDVKK